MAWPESAAAQTPAGPGGEAACMAAHVPLFEDLLQRLATEHKREICELRAEIARLSQYHEEIKSLHGSKGVKDVGNKIGHEDQDVVVLNGSPPLPPRPLPNPTASEPLEDNHDHEHDFKPDMNEDYSHNSTLPTATSNQPDEEALAAAFAVATDLSTDKELMQSVHVWPEPEEDAMNHRRTKSCHMESRPEGLTLWASVMKHVRHEVYVAELPAVHPKWNLQDNTGFNLKNLIGGAQKKTSQAAIQKTDTMSDHKVKAAQHRERMIEITILVLRACLPEMPVSPSSRIRLVWDFFGFLLLVHDLIMAPMYISFDSHPVIDGMPQSYEEFTKTFDIVSAVYWSFDIVMSFLTAYHTNSGIMERRMSAIAIHYLKNWFPIDFTIVCIDLGLIIIMGRSEGGLRAIKTISRAMRITRLLRFAKMSKHVGELMARINSEYVLQVVGLLRLLVVIIVLNHYIACVWFYMTTLPLGKTTWADVRLVGLGHTDLGYAYFSSLHWSLTQFTPASMEIFPQNVYERMFNVVVIMFAFVFFSSFVSSITNAMTHIRNINAKAVARDTMIRRFFSDHNISHGLAARVWHFVRHKRVAQGKKLKTDEVPILNQLPVRIRDELRMEVYGPVLMRHPMLHHYLGGCQAALRKICKKGISELTLQPGKELKFDDEVKKMIFVQSGNLEFHMYDVVEEVEGDAENGYILEAGDWCCEASLWADKVALDGHFIASPVGSDLVLLDAEVFRAVAVENFETLDMLVKYSTLFIERFRGAMQDPTAVRDNLLFNRTDPIRDMVADVTQGMNRRSILSGRLSHLSVRADGSSTTASSQQD